MYSSVSDVVDDDDDDVLLDVSSPPSDSDDCKAAYFFGNGSNVTGCKPPGMPRHPNDREVTFTTCRC